jgi:hypothetical protein
VYLRASVETVPSVEYFINPETPFSEYLKFLLPILEPSLDLLRLWTSHLPFQSRNFLNFHNFGSEPSVKMGRKESDTTRETDTSYPGLWRTKTTCADELQLCEKYSIPSSVRLCFDTRNDGAMVRKEEHEICVYEDMFEAGFRFPFLKVVRELLHYLQITPHQLAPNAWRTFFARVILWPRVLGEGHELLVREFLKIYKLSRNPKTKYIFNFQGRQEIKFVLLPGYSSNKH